MNTAVAQPDTRTAPAPRGAGTATTMELVVTAIDVVARDIRSITLADPAGRALPGFVPGSHLVVHAGTRTNAYSLTGDGAHPSQYSISVLGLDNGNGGSRWLHEHLMVGDTLTVGMPRNAFAPIARARKHLLVAGGIGITPMVSHLRAAVRWRRDVQLLYVFRQASAAHLADVTGLAGTRAELFTDRVSFAERLDQVLRSQPIGTHLYVCGPSSMIDAVVDAATDAGWPNSRIHHERFGIDALDGGEPFRVDLTDSGRTIVVPAGTSMLEALEHEGVPIPNLCRQGVCGECRLPLAAGTPVHRDLFLSAEEKDAADAIMPCVSRAPAGCTLEVPL
ncbi:2Fe-2S iron-sulfur cluster binding domain-containing protein [Gordonia jinghuaiqii]|uniref:Oxidoreductase n=1 Tax=Gordonia jinghuaiqii TaxID=2758710 RepID=A0A7D7R2H2_9ACTN|nr:PDR/VanB family oxidoreductase [Gordonia jinghuaiqii]MCR5979093.1 2Fe-2S iron-sulfur cluster binding domain-containing protein [Gordonia jinghuaiqii]QMT01587.1 oxidoreductase [Gordonia jinghuaiqii]